MKTFNKVMRRNMMNGRKVFVVKSPEAGNRELRRQEERRMGTFHLLHCINARKRFEDPLGEKNGQ